MKRVLFIASVVKTHIMVFHLPYLEWFKRNGYEVHVCAKNDYAVKSDINIPHCDKFYDIPFNRSPLNVNNIKAYKAVKTVINKNDYDIIHCHTPIGGVVGRIAAIDKRKKGAKIIYTAHGFHFFEGASMINWRVFYPIEKLLSKFTDVLITINDEDYNNAINHNFKTNQIVLVNGVGINLAKFKPQNQIYKESLRKKYDYEKEAFILFYAGELSHRKHQDLIIRAASKLKDQIPGLLILLAGTGELEIEYRKLVHELDLEEQVIFLGFRNDIDQLMSLSDIAISSSRQEGLPVNVMEAMATGLPIVATNCRGNRDLVKDNVNGFVVGIDDTEKFSQSISKLYKSDELRKKFSINSLKEIRKYDLDSIMEKMSKIYSNTLKRNYE